MNAPPPGDGTGADPDLVTGPPEVARQAFDRMPIPMASLTGPGHLITACNAAYRAMAGRQDVVGRPAREVLPEPVGHRVLELLDEAYRTGRVVEERERAFQYDGGDGIEHLYQDLTIVPTHDADGTKGLLVVAANVTESVRAQRQAEAGEEAAEERYAAARDLVSSLQDALLPRGLPIVPGVDVAARYLLAAEDTAAGGDWFDAVVRPEGRVALVAGDVVGHGVQASAVMGQLRAVLHDRLLGDDPLDQVAAGLDHFARARPEAAAATVCVVELDPASGRADYVTAGHPPPLVVGTTGETRFLAPSGGGPLATGSTYDVVTERLDPGELVLLYTDGILERPGVPTSQATVDLARVTADSMLDRGSASAAPARATERVTEQALELLTRASGYVDDITLLAAQRVPAVEPLSLRLPAETQSIATVRSHLGRWLEELDVRMLDAIAVQHAVTELVTNVVDHAYEAPRTNGSDTVELRFEIDRRGVLVGTVRDRGRWREPGDADDLRGHGLAMAAGLADELDVRHDETGTVATLRHTLSRDAQLLTGRPSSLHAVRLETGTPYRADVDGDAVTVEGPLDQTTVDLLRAQLLTATRGGARPVSVELSGITHLGSAAVQLFHQLRRTGAACDAAADPLRHEPALRLRAAPGSVAQHVLDLVRLPHDTGLD